MYTSRGRLVFNNQVVYDQVDFFQLDGYTRVVGLTPAQLVCEVYYNNASQSWPLISGVGVIESQVAAGHVYWDPIPAGPYGIRWRPNTTGYWRILISYPAGTQIFARDYDVNSGTGISPPTGLRASFTSGE